MALGERLQSATGQALQHAKQDQLPQGCSESAAKRGDGESGNAGQQEAFAAHVIREPAGDGQNDGIRDQVGRHHPRALFVGRSEISRDVRDGNIDDGGVEDFHEGRQHHRKRDDPWVYRGLGTRIHSSP